MSASKNEKPKTGAYCTTTFDFDIICKNLIASKILDELK